MAYFPSETSTNSNNYLILSKAYELLKYFVHSVKYIIITHFDIKHSPSLFGVSTIIKKSSIWDYIHIMVCRNICERIYSKIQVGEANYSVGKKYCRRCEIYLYHNGIFCPCCGMQLRTTPTTKKGKERLRK
jgi:hypothetical protein